MLQDKPAESGKPVGSTSTPASIPPGTGASSKKALFEEKANEAPVVKKMVDPATTKALAVASSDKRRVFEVCLTGEQCTLTG